MSAYALPGLFPPVEDNYSSISYATTTAMSSIVAAASTTTTKSTNGSFTSLASGTASLVADEPMEDQEASSSSSSLSSNSMTLACHMDQQSNITSRNVCHNRSKSNRNKTHPLPHCSYANLPPLKPLDDESEGPDSGESSSSSMLGIVIKEAKIDPVRLVQYLTGHGSTSNNNNNKTLRRRGCKERMMITNGVGSGSLQNSPVNRRAVVDFNTAGTASSNDDSSNRRRRLCSSSTHHSTNQSSLAKSDSSPHNEAIEFELSITFQGRKYTAKRTMQCMIKLRDDLIREMNARRQWLTRQMPPLHSSTANDQATNSNNSNHYTHSPPLHTIEIPEIPPLNLSGGNEQHQSHSNPSSHHSFGMIGGIGFVGRGFTMLHAMVASYVPVMDRWLKNVMAVVPQDSECLLNFLWEPTCTDNDLETMGSLLETNKDKSISMGSIKELDIEEEEDDAEL
jgi:hypothetical protein